MLFDTSIVIDMLRKRRPYQYGSISTITLLEYVRGVPESEMLETLSLLKQSFQIYAIDDNVVLVYSKLYKALKQRKQIMKDADLIIAATAHTKSEKLLVKDKDFDVLSELIDMTRE